MFNVAYKFVGSHEQAEDLTQDIFLKIFRSLDTFDRRANFQTWLISVSRNLCIDHYRSVRKERQTDRPRRDARRTGARSRPTASPLATLENRDLAALLRQALQTLPAVAADRRSCFAISRNCPIRRSPSGCASRKGP